jgi:hypothetical protein
MADSRSTEPDAGETGETGGAHEEDTVASPGYAERQPVDAGATEDFADEAERLEAHNRPAGDSEGLRGPAQHEHGRFARGSNTKPTGEPGDASTGGG